MKHLPKRYLAKAEDRAHLEMGTASLAQDHPSPAELATVSQRRVLLHIAHAKTPTNVLQRSTSTSTKPIGRNARTQNDRPVGGNVDAEWTHDLHAQNNPAASLSRPASKKLLRPGQANRLHSAIHGSASSPALNSQFNVVTPSRPGISIRGIAGPYVVMAKNFAHGTTAADIESAMTPVGGVALNCRLIAELPNVIAEITFETKEGADNVVHTFNNQSVSPHSIAVALVTNPSSGRR